MEQEPDIGEPAFEPMEHSMEGQLLIAMPNMRDPRFEHALVLVCTHDDEHAMGVIVNKPLADLTLSELLEQLDIEPRESAEDEPVLFGGPVKTDRGLVLHTLDYRSAATLEINEVLGLTATREVLVDLGGRGDEIKAPKKAVLALGHAGWDAGQLESEIRQNAWAHCAARLDLVFPDDRRAAWRRAMASLGVTDAMFSPEWAEARPDDAPLN